MLAELHTELRETLAAFGARQPRRLLVNCATHRCTHTLGDLKKPVGVSNYVTRLVATLPAPLKDAVPSIAELERELKPLATLPPQA